MSESYFKTFKEAIRQLGGIWASNDVHFSQFSDEYVAAFLPAYPEKDEQHDHVISFKWKERKWELDGKDTNNGQTTWCVWDKMSMFWYCRAANLKCCNCCRCINRAKITERSFLAIQKEEIGICTFIVFSGDEFGNWNDWQMINVNPNTDEQAWQETKKLAQKWQKQFGLNRPTKLYGNHSR